MPAVQRKLLKSKSSSEIINRVIMKKHTKLKKCVHKKSDEKAKIMSVIFLFFCKKLYCDLNEKMLRKD